MEKTEKVPPTLTPITIETLYNHLDCVNHMDFSTIIVDLRSQSEFDLGHVPGALSLPLESIGEDSIEFIFERLTKKGKMILEPKCKYFFYSSSDIPPSTLTTLTTTLKTKNKKPNFYILEGGYKKWETKGYQILSETQPPKIRVGLINRVFPSVVLPDFLYLGCLGSTHPKVLAALRISCVLSAAMEAPKLKLVKQLKLDLNDTVYQNITVDNFKKAFKFINKAAKKKKKCLYIVRLVLVGVQRL